MVKATKKKWKRKYVCIIDDSMVKHSKGWNLSNKLDQNYYDYVQNLPGAKFRSRKDNTKPCICEENTDNTIVHVGTKERNSEKKNEELIGKSIADFAKILANYKKR